jgi:hypothetical protein
VGGGDRERRRQRRGVTAVHHVVEDHPGHIHQRTHRGPAARGNGALARVPFFQQFARAGLITLIAAHITEATAQGVSFFDGVEPTLVVVGGIVMLVAGMTSVGAAQDAIDQFYVTASARLLDVVMRTAGIVVGIVASLELAWRLGAPLSISPDPELAWRLWAPLSISPDPVALGPLGAQFVGATLNIRILRAVGVCRSGNDRARRRHGPAGLGGLDLHRLHRGTRQHARRFCRGARPPPR